MDSWQTVNVLNAETCNLMRIKPLTLAFEENCSNHCDTSTTFLSSCLFPEFPQQLGDGVEAGADGGDAAGSEKEGGPDCQTPAPAAQGRDHGSQDSGRVQTGWR